MGLALTYARVSTVDQSVEGLSLKQQAAALKAYCDARKLKQVEHIEDRGVSGTKPLAARRGGARLLALLDDGAADAVIVTRLDRAWRNVANSAACMTDWRDRGIALHVIDLGGAAVDTTTPHGQFMITLLVAVAAWEAGMTRERIRAVMRHKQERGEWTGGCAPYGFAIEGTRLVKHRDEQAVIAVMRELREAGESLRAIADILRAQGHTARGRRWYPMTVQRALKRSLRP